MTHYLYPRQRRIEVIGALYAGGLGTYIGLSSAVHGKPPVGWLGLDPFAQTLMAGVLVNLAMIWAVGIKINGSWWCSPCLRLFAMLGFFGFAVFATIKGNGSSATYTYGWVAFFVALGAVNAARDSVKSWQRRRVWKRI